MRKLRLTLIAAILLSTVSVVSAQQSLPLLIVAGGGRGASLTPGTTFLVFSITATFIQNIPDGRIVIDWPETGEHLEAAITCIVINENIADVTATINVHDNPYPPHNTSHLILHIVDNGFGGSDVPDDLLGHFENLNAGECGSHTDVLPILEGNLFVFKQQ